jgi:hypothetical protein
MSKPRVGDSVDSESVCTALYLFSMGEVDVV